MKLYHPDYVIHYNLNSTRNIDKYKYDLICYFTLAHFTLSVLHFEIKQFCISIYFSSFFVIRLSTVNCILDKILINLISLTQMDLESLIRDSNLLLKDAHLFGLPTEGVEDSDDGLGPSK